MLRRLVLGVLAVLFMGGPVTVSAAPITFAFAGLVSQEPLLDPADPFAGTIARG